MHPTGFAPVTQESRQDFLPYREQYCFGDMTFASLYAWRPMFDYRCLQNEKSILVAGSSADGEHSAILYRKPDADLAEVLRSYIPAEGSLMLEYIPEEQLPEYAAAADALGLRFRAFFQEKYSDYLYRRLDYCSLNGQRQKSLRADVNALKKQIPDIRMVRYHPEQADACLKLFDRWCTGRRCAECVYGCERTAFARFLEVFREPDCFGAAAFSGSTMLSFAFGEILPGGVLDLHFQKNAFRQRGLTYWLSRELALQYPECDWIDLEEDMDLPGMRMDKQRLHPAFLKRKFTVVYEVTG